ncbi:antenna complex alpha/beta subunit [Methylocella silvestris BL2]|uniref:Antenna complex alpha/beta subunit n=1 Tax=Methylocella silvestris (strain DSM 15510 / CIP 108128 / LMG 27833 / NCIMB 13906 / BL2) TaxID=395965 RepID=B8EPZ2_METSB|nr:light-harvesting antenna LH1, beta subunit [Methylocella silvestris]ACK50996.1 antenna complex alpha/beta subunit [Methylocella silvestris BL2]
MINDIDGRSSLSGLSDSEAKEFHKLFVTSFLIFTGIAIVAHILVWMWRPWIPGPNGYSSLIDSARDVAMSVIPHIV